MSEPRKTNKKEKVKQRRKEPVKITTPLYNTGDIEDIAYSERSERYPI